MRKVEDEKVEKYPDLAREVRKIWGARTNVLSVVVGALGSAPMNLKNNLKVIDVEISVGIIKECAPLESARILRKVLEMESRGKQADCAPWLPSATAFVKADEDVYKTVNKNSSIRTIQAYSIFLF